MNQPHRFWAWFQQQEHRFRPIKDSVGEELLDEFEEQLHAVSDGLYFEIGGKPEGPYEVVITAGGDPQYFPTVRELIAAAPVIPGWEFIAFKPANNFQYHLKYQDLSLNPSEMWFLPLCSKQEPSFLGIRVAIPGYDESEKDNYLNACWLALDSGLGEVQTAEEIHHLEVCGVPENPEGEGFIELPELGDYIEWRKRKITSEN
jgi:hypothetical protein